MYGDKLEENVACRKKVFYFRPKKKQQRKSVGAETSASGVHIMLLACPVPLP